MIQELQPLPTQVPARVLAKLRDLAIAAQVAEEKKQLAIEFALEALGYDVATQRPLIDPLTGEITRPAPEAVS